MFNLHKSNFFAGKIFTSYRKYAISNLSSKNVRFTAGVVVSFPSRA